MGQIQVWTEAVRGAAQEAALAEDRRRMGWDVADQRMPPFAYRWEHVQQVVRNAHWLLSQVEADRDVVIAGCWLHDVKKAEPNHAKRGAQFARTFLANTDFPAQKIESVARAIELHAGLWRPAEKNWDKQQPFRPAAPLTPIETALVWDADKLSKIGPIALLHWLPAQLFDLQTRQQSITTEQLIMQNKKRLDTLMPRIIASFNTLAAQRKAIELHAAYKLFWQTGQNALAL
ncbi:MAG: HD domain-containing protein [Ardenticatenaceae bacterium]